MTTQEQAERIEPVSHEHDDRFDPTGKVRAFPGARVRRERHSHGVTYNEAALRKVALDALRAKNRKLHGKRGAGHVALTGWTLRLYTDSKGRNQVKVDAAGYRHKTFETFTATAAL